MADQFENQLPQKSDAKWVRALDASGNPILISKEDLASVVGGLIGRVSSSNNGWVDKDLDFFHRYVITSDTDFNVITKPGMYNLYATKSTNNSPGYDYGLLVVFSSGGQILQIAADVFTQRYCLRTRRDNGVWTSWKGIALT